MRSLLFWGAKHSRRVKISMVFLFSTVLFPLVRTRMYLCVCVWLISFITMNLQEKANCAEFFSKMKLDIWVLRNFRTVYHKVSPWAPLVHTWYKQFKEMDMFSQEKTRMSIYVWWTCEMWMWGLCSQSMKVDLWCSVWVATFDSTSGVTRTSLCIHMIIMCYNSHIWIQCSGRWA